MTSRCAWGALALSAAGISVWTAWSAADSWQVAGGDYSHDYAPAMNALLEGHPGALFSNLPTNGAGGSVLLRAPFAILGELLSGDQLAVFRFGALGCLLALLALGLWLAADMPRRGVRAPTRVGVIALFAGAPALLEAVYYGHPEEALGAALCVAAVLAAGARRPMLAGSLLGLAVINKPWGVLAIGPVIVCAPTARARILLPAGAIIGCWLTTAGLFDASRLWLSVHGAETSIVAHPQDLWWPLAHTGGLYPLPPALLSAHARQLAVVLAVAIAVAIAIRARGSGARIGTQSALALLALGFALRCLLEPAPHGYYQLPLVIALGAWEVRARRSVALSLGATILLALDFRRLNEAAAAIPFLLYLAVLLPLCAMLLADLLGGLTDRSSLRGLSAKLGRLERVLVRAQSRA